MKRLLSVITAIFLITSLILAASATGTLLSDDADLLDTGEEEKLSALLEELSDEAGASIAVVTVNYYDGYDIELYVEDFCDSGFMDNGIVLLVSIGTREYCLTKCGSVESAIDDRGLDFIEEAFLPYLSDGDYYVAFSVFAEMSKNAIVGYDNSGEVYDGDDFAPDIDVLSDGSVRVTEGSRPISHYLICLVIGLALALISMLIMQRGMKTVRSQDQAGNYIVSGSLDIRVSTDRFLYRTVSKTPKPKSNNSSGGHSGGGFSGGGFSGGGSHRSSSGRF